MDGRENPFSFSIATALKPWQLKKKKIRMTARPRFLERDHAINIII